MLTANQLKPLKATSNTSISGQAGKRVLCSPQALPIFNNLVKLAKNGNHWAGLIVRGIQGLSSGTLDRDNIYIEKKKSLAYGNGAFHIVLPGVTASLEKHPNGSYILQRIKTDNNYQKLQQDSEKPGLWRVDKNTNTTPDLQHEGMILDKEYRPVVISDMANADAGDVANTIRTNIAKTDGMIKDVAKIQGFDMHYTPGDGGIVGLKPAKKALATARDSDITQSAMLLANTMFQARNIEGVLWYSDWGGSAVLTRAMEILHHEKNISLENHMIFLNKPTTKANYAIELAGKLGITPNAKGKKTGLHPKELKGNILVSDVGANGDTLAGTLKTAGFGIGVAGATFAVTTVALTAPAIVGVTGAMFFVGGAIKSAITNLKGNNY